MEPFDDVLTAAAQQVFPGCEVRVVDSVCVRVFRGEAFVAEHWCSLPEESSRGLPFAERVRMTADYLRLFLPDRRKHYDEAPWDHLMPLVRPACLLHDPKAAGNVVGRRLSPDLVELPGVDSPEVTEIVLLSQVDRWKVSVDQLYAAARRNLAGHSLECQVLPIGATGEGAAFVVEPYGYEPSWLLFPDRFAPLMGEVANPVQGPSRQLVLPVSRNEMLLLPEADEKAVAAALSYAADRYVTDPRAMLPFALVHDGGTLVPWVLPGSPLARGSWLQRRRFVRDQYAAQVQLLAQEPGRAQDLARQRLAVPPVAGHGILPTAVVVDVHGDRPLLPEVEYLDLRSDRGRVVVPWEQAGRVLGLRSVEEYWPTRWAVGAWPGEPRLWEALRAAQVDPGVLEREG